MDIKKKESQLKQIKRWLELYGALTPLEALDHFGCFRLAAYIHRLRNEGWDIKTDESKGYATYIYINPDMP